MHLIIVYNLFGETKHLLRSWRLSSSPPPPPRLREHKESLTPADATNFDFSFPADSEAHLKCIKERLRDLVACSALHSPGESARLTTAHCKRENRGCKIMDSRRVCATPNDSKLFNEIAAIVVSARKSTFACLSSITAFVSAVYQSLGVHFFTPTCAPASVINVRLGLRIFSSAVLLARSQPISIVGCAMINLRRKKRGRSDKARKLHDLRNGILAEVVWSKQNERSAGRQNRSSSRFRVKRERFV
jgi:hypothetical protein